MSFLSLFLIFIFLQAIRYAVIAGTTHLGISLAPAQWQERHRVQSKPIHQKDILREIKYSSFTILIYSAIYALLFNSEVYPHTELYFRIADKGWLWFILSLPLLILIHETYFYWMHRFLHLPKVFLRVHRVHHLSTNPSPWAAQSFHPFEAFVEMIWIVPVIFFIPLHPLVLIAFSFFSLTLNVLGHAHADPFPDHEKKSAFLKQFNTTTHHNRHHQYYTGHYGLYFRFWDQWMNTEKVTK